MLEKQKQTNKQTKTNEKETQAVCGIKLFLGGTLCQFLQTNISKCTHFDLVVITHYGVCGWMCKGEWGCVGGLCVTIGMTNCAHLY